MAILITIESKTSLIKGPFGPLAARMSMSLEGRKQWLSPERLRYETSAHNLRILMDLFPAALVQDARKDAVDVPSPTSEPQNGPTATPVPAFVLPPTPQQLENFERFKDKPIWAIFSEQGTGKTKVCFDIVSHRFLKGTVTGMIVLSSPKGVHAQWIDEQLPKHLWPAIKPLCLIWDGRKPPAWIERKTDRLEIVSGNIDMVRSKQGRELLKAFAAKHGKRLIVIVDESDSIKSITSSRSRYLREIAAVTKQRGIMTGTPIAKDLTDEWAQFYFLDPDIIGHKYLTSFRSQYCVMGGFENRSVINHKNLDQFKAMTAPHIFRSTKRDLGLPPKIYDSVTFELEAEQKRMIRELRDQFFSEITKTDEVVAVKNGATLLMRIQQISNGYTIDEFGKLHELPNPRLKTLTEFRKQISGPLIIWCRFKEDVKIVHEAFKQTSVTYHGPDNDAARKKSKDAFLLGKASEIIATAGAMGKGVDGLQRVCGDAVYYSNSYNAIDRWQSEDRIDRIGMVGSSSGGGSSAFFDLIARGSTDRAILANLKRKKDISGIVLGDNLKEIIEIMESIE